MKACLPNRYVLRWAPWMVGKKPGGLPLEDDEGKRRGGGPSQISK